MLVKSLARPRDALDSLENVLDVPCLRPRIHDDDAQNPAAIEHGRADIAIAAFIEFFLDLPVNPVGVLAVWLAKAKAQDVRMRFMQRLKTPNGLREIGYASLDIPALVEGTLPQHRVTKLSPKPANAEELSRLFEDAMVTW